MFLFSFNVLKPPVAPSLLSTTFSFLSIWLARQMTETLASSLYLQASLEEGERPPPGLEMIVTLVSSLLLLHPLSSLREEGEAARGLAMIATLANCPRLLREEQLQQ